MTETRATYRSRRAPQEPRHALDASAAFQAPLPGLEPPETGAGAAQEPTDRAALIDRLLDSPVDPHALARLMLSVRGLPMLSTEALILLRDVQERIEHRPGGDPWAP